MPYEMLHRDAMTVETTMPYEMLHRVAMTVETTMPHEMLHKRCNDRHKDDAL